MTIGSTPKPYQLNLSLMAAAPIGGGAAFEDRRILAATKMVELQLVVADKDSELMTGNEEIVIILHYTDVEYKAINYAISYES